MLYSVFGTTLTPVTAPRLYRRIRQTLFYFIRQHGTYPRLIHSVPEHHPEFPDGRGAAGRDRGAVSRWRCAVIKIPEGASTPGRQPPGVLRGQCRIRAHALMAAAPCLPSKVESDVAGDAG